MIDIAVLLILSTTAPAASPPAVPADLVQPAATDKLVCKRQAVTGSLVTSKRVCMTRRDWNRTAEQSQKFGTDMVEGLRGRPNGQ